MKKLMCLFMMLLLNLAMADLEVMTEGAKPGVWTMDMDAAMAQAKTSQKPVLLLFTGSDWCGWCKKLEAKVLTQDVWKTFAKDNLMLVYLDFPEDKTKVPEKFQKRNEALQEKFGIEGFPTLILLDENGKKLDDLHYEATAERFIFKLKQPLRFHRLFFDKLTAGMPEQELKTLKQERQAVEDNAKRVIELHKQIEALEQQAEKLTEKTDKDMDNWIVKSRLPQKYEEYKKLSEDYYALQEKFLTWIKSQPQKNEENDKKFKNYKETLEKMESDCIKLLSEALNAAEK